MSRQTLRRVLLVGFMGSGKTEVGRRLAMRLNWSFVDFDEVIESEVGMTVADMFAARGEAHFRSVEERVAAKLLSRENTVLSSGGGWAAKPGRLDGLPPGTESFWLQVSAEEAVRRVGRQLDRRPLLAGSDASELAVRLLRERTPHYERAAWAVDTVGMSVEDVAARIHEILEREYPQAGT